MPSSGKSVVALNGFLGRPSDWSLIPGLLPGDWRLQAVDLWQPPTISNFETWAKQTAAQISNENASPKKVLLGYSLGGRLALHLLIAAPQLFAGAVIVSAHPGLANEDEREKRRKADDLWARRFLQGEWTSVLVDWNAQAALRPPMPSLADALTLHREERDFDRAKLADELRTWSLGAQRDLRNEIAQLEMPIQFVTGEQDSKFTSIARELCHAKSKGPREHVVISGAGHRAPWDAPSHFRTALAEFLARW